MQNEQHILLNAVKCAGAAILELQSREFTINQKTNAELVTEADLLANEILKQALLPAFPTIGWLSEECVDDYKRLEQEQVWIVDPIDGTIEFSKRMPEYAISVAMVQNGIPQIAVVFNPAKDELFHAIRNVGAWCNDERIQCRVAKDESLSLLSSRSEEKRGEWEIFKKEHHVAPVGSIAYKLALVAAGKADATFSRGPKSEWDIAAGTLLVTEAGGVVTDLAKQKFIFNQKNVKTNGIVASSNAAYSSVMQMIDRSLSNA